MTKQVIGVHPSRTTRSPAEALHAMGIVNLSGLRVVQDFVTASSSVIVLGDRKMTNERSAYGLEFLVSIRVVDVFILLESDLSWFTQEQQGKCLPDDALWPNHRQRREQHESQFWQTFSL